MNPQNRPTRPIQDVGPPPPNAAQNVPPTTNLVQNIPMRVQARAANEDAELDNIMQNVDKDLKQARQKPQKAGFFSKKPKLQPASEASAPQQVAQQLPAAEPPAPKPADKNSAPVLVIFMTIIVTGGLIAAAIYAYK